MVINLRKIQEACCYEPTGRKGRPDDQFDEDDFNTETVRCVLRVLPIRKSETVGDRIVRFLGVFLRVASEKGEDICICGRTENMLTHLRQSARQPRA